MVAGPVLPSGKAAKVTWVISWDGENVFLSGPLQDKLLALGCLEIAKQSVHNFTPLHIAPAGAAGGKPN